MISASPNLEVTPYATGYLAESRVLAAGANQVLFQKLAPVEVVLPGLRGLVGDAMVWVKLQPTKGTGIPKELAMWDDTSKRVGRQFVGAQRRNFGAILGQDDRVQVPMMMAGTFQVTVYLLSMGKKRTVRPLRVVLDTKITLPLQLGDNPHRVVAGFDVKKMQDAVTQLAQQEAAAAAGK